MRLWHDYCKGRGSPPALALPTRLLRVGGDLPGPDEDLALPGLLHTLLGLQLRLEVLLTLRDVGQGILVGHLVATLQTGRGTIEDDVEDTLALEARPLEADHHGLQPRHGNGSGVGLGGVGVEPTLRHGEGEGLGIVASGGEFDGTGGIRDKARDEKNLGGGERVEHCAS